MDRPEDVEANPVDRQGLRDADQQHRGARREQVDAANPRAENAFGHIIEMTATGRRPRRRQLHLGHPGALRRSRRRRRSARLWNPATSANGWFASPDNCAFDAAGDLWVTTDQGETWAKSGTADGVWAVGTEGDARGTGQDVLPRAGRRRDVRPLLHAGRQDAVRGGAASRHRRRQGLGQVRRASTFEDPATRWPDFQPGMPPRPSVVAITKDDGGVIGA